jgi:alpha-galactosidase
MQGSLGVGANLNKWKPEDFSTAKSLIESYKKIRPVVEMGTLYRLVSPRGGSNFSSTESVSPDLHTAVVFAFLHSEQMEYPSPTVFPRGLAPTAVYSVHAVAGKLSPQTPGVASGAYWMGHGINFDLKGDYVAAAITLSMK